MIDYPNYHLLPPLYAVSTTGKVKVIRLYVTENEDGTAIVCNEHGYNDGKKQLDEKIITVGKNIGKANETTPLEQAQSECKSKWQAKKDKKNYTENTNGIPSMFEMSLIPMLAHKFLERWKDIIYRALGQPKLDGLRCLAGLRYEDPADVRFTSRGFKEYSTVTHLVREAKRLIEMIARLSGIEVSEITLDGELWRKGLTIQDINRVVRGAKPDDLRDIHLMEYHVYDLAIPGLTNEERANLLAEAMILTDLHRIKYVRTVEITCKEDVYKYHDEFVAEGYEGIIIRNLLGLYLFNDRSKDLQKLKNFQDAEFEVIGYTCADAGREAGAIIYECQEPNPLNGHDGKFTVRPTGSVPERIERYNNNPEQYIGQFLTVRFAMDRSEDNMPQFVVGVDFRLKEDLPL